MTDTRHIFHLSIPVADLAAAKRFYSDVLGARIGRTNDDWLDVLLWGHQITLQRRPDEVRAPEAQGKRHFGVVLPWAEWEAVGARLRARNAPFLSPPAVTHAGTPEEQGKIYLSDPSHNVIEIKAYRNLSATIGYEAE
ncbi:MAG TPA: VOC family protein [Polyangia bacterium]|nr:VOC family protein [Polyangia bacterium]